MFSVNLESAIQFLVDTHLNKRGYISHEDKQTTREGLFIRFPVEVRDGMGNDKRHMVNMIFCGNVQVYYLVTDSFIKPRYDWSLYKNTSSHDSCWRSDGFQFLTQMYFNMCNEIRPDVAPIMLNSDASWLNWTEIKRCEVVTKRKTGDDYGYDIVDVQNMRTI